MRGIGKQAEKKDYIKLGGNLQKKDILRFHLNEDFDARKYCDFLKDKKEQVLPAPQKETASVRAAGNASENGA